MLGGGRSSEISALFVCFASFGEVVEQGSD